jgi:6-phosphogluconolactonase
MKSIVLVCLLSLTESLPAIPVFIGTNTGKNTTSKGIYRADFDPETGKLTEPELAAEYHNPGFLARHPTKPILLAVGSPNKTFADGTSSIAAFSIGPDHSLKFLGEASTGGRDACHLAIDATGNTVAVGNYSGAKSTGWPANADLMDSIRLRPCLRVVER